MGASAWRLLARAQRLAGEQKLDDALALAQQAMAQAPGQPGVRLQMALLHIDRGEPQEALALLDRDVPPENPAWPVFRALACLDLGELDRAREHLRTALQLASDNRVAWGLKATVYMRAGRTAEAMKILDKAGIEASPRLIGRLLVEVERTLITLGVAEGSRMRTVDPSTPPPDATLGTSTAGSAPLEATAGTVPPEGTAGTVPPEGTAGAARPEGTAGTVPAEPDVDPPVPWDTTPYRSGTLDVALGALIDPMVAQRHVGRAEKMLMTQQPQKALEEARLAVHRYKDVPRGFCLLGLAYLHSGHPAEALRCLEEAARRDGETPDVLYAQGCCYHEIGELDRARERLEKMLEGFEKDASARYTLGQIALEQGRELEARRHLEAAAFLDFLVVKDRVERLKKALAEPPKQESPRAEP